MKNLIILVGNIGSGKTTLAKEYVKEGYIAIARDQLRYAIGDGKYIFDSRYEPIIWQTERYLFRKFIDMRVDIIVDEVGISRRIRSRYIDYAKINGYYIIAIELPRFSKEECVKRRMRNPHDQPDKDVWNEVWEKFNEGYEEPSEDEGIDKVIRIS